VRRGAAPDRPRPKAVTAKDAKDAKENKRKKKKKQKVKTRGYNQTKAGNPELFNKQ
jgi:hypothetical protein